jgi:transcriptional regulator with XRE-family HTH domain
MFDTHRLAAMVIAKRGERGLRAVATEIGGVSASTLSRVEQGKLPDLDTFLRLCRWLGVSPEQFTDGPAEEPAVQNEPRMEVIAAHLRADRTLDRATAQALERMVRLAYDAARAGAITDSDKE